MNTGEEPGKQNVQRMKVLVTGAYGLIGNLVAGSLLRQAETYDVYGLDLHAQPSPRIRAEDVTPIPPGRFFQADLADLPAMTQAVQGMDAVVHMAADAGSGPWESLLKNNLVGAYHLFEACHRAGARRVVFASTVMVNAGTYRQEPYRAILEGRFDDLPDPLPRISHETPPSPTSLYAASKLWGETLAYQYAFVHEMSCLCLRIGWVVAENRPRPNYGRSVWCSHRDICQLVQKCLEAPLSLRFDIFYGFSRNRYQIANLEHACQVLGYNPQDSADDYP
jgi:nucleoside-diphosphate-sugar epimerase